MSRGRGGLAVVGGALLLASALAYLRDPPWLLTLTSGMRPWETDDTGARARWMGGHASFFVRSDARTIEIPLRTSFETSDTWPVTVAITIDDRPADRLVLAGLAWQRSTIRLPAPGSRHDRTRHDNRGAQIGEIGIR